jgi:uncharacterized protein YneF (UPF0154 family)
MNLWFLLSMMALAWVMGLILGMFLWKDGYDRSKEHKRKESP